MKRWLFAALTLASIGGVASAAKLTDASRIEIKKLLDIVATGEEVGETRYGELAQGEFIDLPLAGDHRFEYYVNVICDDDCVNVDLAIMDPDGVELDVDDADDNAPVVNVHPDVFDADNKPAPWSLTIQIRMKSCKAATCGYGVRVRKED